MTPILRRLAATFESIPHDLIAIIARISIGTVFWRSAMTKIEGLSLKPSTFYLFENDYRLPLVPPAAFNLVSCASSPSLTPSIASACNRSSEFKPVISPPLNRV